MHQVEGFSYFNHEVHQGECSTAFAHNSGYKAIVFGVNWASRPYTTAASPLWHQISAPQILTIFYSQLLCADARKITAETENVESGGPPDLILQLRALCGIKFQHTEF